MPKQDGFIWLPIEDIQFGVLYKNKIKYIYIKIERKKNQPLRKGDRSWTTLDVFDCRKTLIGLGKYQLLHFAANDPETERDVTGTLTDLDLIIMRCA